VSWNEYELHRWLARRLAGAPLKGGFGNDAAHLSRALVRPVVCVDGVVEGVHFEPDTRPGAIGAKACARALSDLAASAARPRAVLAALRAGSGWSERALRDLLGAVDDAAREFGARLVGGDLSFGEGPLGLTVTAVGERSTARVLARSGARAGDVIVLTGPCGGSRLGRHLQIRPRIAEGLWLASRGARAMLDLSDGLGQDLGRMARASGLAIELEHVPVHRDAERAARRDGRTALEHALADGEDHELAAALPERALPRLLRERARHCPALVVVGRARQGRGVRLSRALAASVGPRALEGWIHRG
jgi:thiamine-monophosphate kinase